MAGPVALAGYEDSTARIYGRPGCVRRTGEVERIHSLPNPPPLWTADGGSCRQADWEDDLRQYLRGAAGTWSSWTPPVCGDDPDAGAVTALRAYCHHPAVPRWGSSPQLAPFEPRCPVQGNLQDFRNVRVFSFWYSSCGSPRCPWVVFLQPPRARQASRAERGERQTRPGNFSTPIHRYPELSCPTQPSIRQRRASRQRTLSWRPTALLPRNRSMTCESP